MFILELIPKELSDSLSVLALVVSIGSTLYMLERTKKADAKEEQKEANNKLTRHQKAWIIWKLEEETTIEDLKKNWKTPVEANEISDGGVPVKPSDTRLEELLTELSNDVRVFSTTQGRWKSV